MPRKLTAQRRAAEKEFLQVLLSTGQHLSRKAPEPLHRTAARNVVRRLRILHALI